MAVDINNMSLEQLKEYESLLLEEQRLRQMQEQQSIMQVRLRESTESKLPKLLEQLSGRLPSKGPIYQTAGSIVGAGPISVSGSSILQEKQRRNAYKEMINVGYTDSQIKLLLDMKKADAPKILGQTIGGTAGSIGLPLLLGQVPPFTALPEEAITIPLSMAIFGAGAGGALGETAQIRIQEKRLPTSTELLKATGEEMASEAGGRLLFKGLKLAFSPFIKKTVPEAVALIDDYAKKGGHFLPGQIDKRWTLQIGDEVARGAFISKGIMKNFDEISQARIILYADDVIESMGKGFSRNPTEAGEMLLDMIKRPGTGGAGKGKILIAFEDLVKPLYKQVDEMTKTASVSTKGLKNYADDLLKKDERLKKLYLSSSGRSKLKKIADLDEYIKFNDMQDLRSSFIADIRKLSKDADKADAIIKQIAKLSDEAMFDPKITKGMSDEAIRLLRNTNAIYKTGKEVLENTFPFKLAKQMSQSPEKAVKLFKPGDVNGIRNLRKTLTIGVKGKPNPEGKMVWNQLRQQWLAQTIENSISNNQINRKTFERMLNKMGMPALREMFDPAELGRINRITMFLDITQKAGTSGTTLFSKSLQVGGATAAYYKAKKGEYIGATAAGTLAISPIAYAMLATNPKGAKLLIQGIRLTPGSEKLGPLAVRMIRLLKQIHTERLKADVKTRRQMQIMQQISAESKVPIRPIGGRHF